MNKEKLYLNKYLKYKNKYLKIKLMHEGGDYSTFFTDFFNTDNIHKYITNTINEYVTDKIKTYNNSFKDLDDLLNALLNKLNNEFYNEKLELFPLITEIRNFISKNINHYIKYFNKCLKWDLKENKFVIDNQQYGSGGIKGYETDVKPKDTNNNITIDNPIDNWIDNPIASTVIGGGVGLLISLNIVLPPPVSGALNIFVIVCIALCQIFCIIGKVINYILNFWHKSDFSLCLISY